MQLDAVLRRAESAINQGIRYKLGKGGFNPGSPSPAQNGQCDCTGFISWCFGFSRQTRDHFYVRYNNGWIETSAVWADIGSNAGIFEPSNEKVGAVIVYGDSGGSQGHIALIVGQDRIVHCSKGNDNKFGDAIQETSMSVFRGTNARIGWLYGLS